MLGRTGNRKYRPSEKQKPDPVVAKANKRQAARFYQFKTGHCLTGQYLTWTTRRPDATCWWCQYSTQTREHLFKNCPQWKCQQKTCGRPSRRRPTSSPAAPGAGTVPASRSCSPTSGAVRRCSSSLRLQTSVGRQAEDEEGAASEASEWEARDQAERLEVMRAEEVRLGEGGGFGAFRFFL